MTSFESLVRERFAFLTELFAMRRIKVEKSARGEAVTYRNTTTGVRITFEPMDGGIFVYVIRLRDGKVPPYPIFIKEDTVLDWFRIQEITSVREPSLQLVRSLKEASFHPPKGELTRILTPMARAVRKHCGDILRGDLTLLDELEPKLRQQAIEFWKSWQREQRQERQTSSRQPSKTRKSSSQ